MNELIADELLKLAELRKQGVLTDTEFGQRKALLMARQPGTALPTGLKALFGCLGAIVLVVLGPIIIGQVAGSCDPQPVSASQTAQSAQQAAHDAAAAASAAADAVKRN